MSSSLSPERVQMTEHHHHTGGCAHAVHHMERASSALAHAEEICRNHGARLTPIRRQVLEALYSTHRPLGAYDLVQKLASDGRTIAPITIYRALDFLMEQGLAHRLASHNAYIACPHGHAPQDLVAFLICEQCGGVDEIASPFIVEAVSGLLTKEGFEPRMQVLEISGLCEHCRKGQ
jgi:Fur family transcriptional regulator, zinc uptake regulator